MFQEEREWRRQMAEEHARLVELHERIVETQRKQFGVGRSVRGWF